MQIVIPLCLGLKNYIQAANNFFQNNITALLILILPCMQTFPDRKCQKFGFESNLENIKK